MKPRSALQQKKIQEASQAAGWGTVLKKRKDRPEEAVRGVKEISEYLYTNYGERAVRGMSAFNRSLKTKDIGKITLAVAQHMFGMYSTPKHLQACWTGVNTGSAGHWTQRGAEAEHINNAFTKMRELQRNWFICVATGGSLYKEHTKAFLTKKETHRFLTCAFDVTFDEALIYALAASHTDDIGIQTRLFKSKLAKKQVINFGEQRYVPVTALSRIEEENAPFWRDVVRYFAQHPVSINLLNDLIDYLTAMRGQDQNYNMKGRTIDSLTSQMQQWHRDLGRVKRMGNRTWAGVPVADAEYLNEGRDPKCDWSFVQIKTSKMLADEGNKMHHCVYSYQTHCISGRTSIWSMKRRFSGAGANYERAITLEVNNNEGSIVQIRGYANRLATDRELEVIRTWAAENGLRVARSRW